MSQMDAALRAMALVEERLQAPVDVAAMAEAAGYSLYYFCRLFSALTRHTPHDYLIRRRMTEAAGPVVGGQQRIIDIALDYQFESHEGFTRAFGRVFGLPPSAARQQGEVDPLRCLPPLTRGHLRCLRTHDGLTPTILPASAAPTGRAAFADGDALAVRWNQEATRRPLQPLDGAGATPAQAMGAGALPAARFTLSPDAAELPLVLDWVLHTWLFYAPYRLAAPARLAASQAPTGNGPPCLYVPITRHAVCPR
jgi:AraC-like DNA-binding protein